MKEKQRKISWEELEKLNEELIKKTSEEKFDSLLCVASGGLILGKLLSDYKKIPLALVIAKSYPQGKQTKNPVKISNIASIKNLFGKTLLIDDLVDSGDTLTEIINLLKKKKEITEIKTAVIFVKPTSRFTPNFYVQKTKDWIIFPYEKKEFS